MGNSSISMGHGFHGELLNNQRVSIKNPQSLRQSFCIPENPYHEINQIITPNSEFFVGCWSKYPKSPKKNDRIPCVSRKVHEIPFNLLISTLNPIKIHGWCLICLKICPWNPIKIPIPKGPSTHQLVPQLAPAGPVEDPSPTIQELEVASPRTANLKPAPLVEKNG